MPEGVFFPSLSRQCRERRADMFHMILPPGDPRQPGESIDYTESGSFLPFNLIVTNLRLAPELTMAGVFEMNPTTESD